MIEYIKLYNKINGLTDEEIISRNEKNENFIFDNIEIPEDYEGSHAYSSNAKQSQQAIVDYLEKASDNEVLFYTLREKIYNGDRIEANFLTNFESQKKFDCIFL